MKNALRLLVLALAASSPVVPAARAELLYASTGNTIAQFDSATPGTVTSVTITGLQGGESIVGIDRRPANGLIYGIGSSNRLYTINATTGARRRSGAREVSL